MPSWIAMHQLLWSALIAFLAPAQSVDEPTDLLRKVQSIAESTNRWRAEVVERSALTGGGMNLKSEVRIRIAVEAPLKMRRENSGDDQTVLVCDGAESFYSGDGHSYYRGEAKMNPDCNFALSRFYNLEKNPTTTAIVGRDHVRLTDGDRRCVLVRAGWKQETLNSVRTLCIDPASMVILRDVAETEEKTTGVRTVRTTTFITYESNPRFQRDTFKISIPRGAVQATPPR